MWGFGAQKPNNRSKGHGTIGGRQRTAGALWGGGAKLQGSASEFLRAEDLWFRVGDVGVEA